MAFNLHLLETVKLLEWAWLSVDSEEIEVALTQGQLPQIAVRHIIFWEEHSWLPQQGLFQFLSLDCKLFCKIQDNFIFYFFLV